MHWHTFLTAYQLEKTTNFLLNNTYMKTTAKKAGAKKMAKAPAKKSPVRKAAAPAKKAAAKKTAAKKAAPKKAAAKKMMPAKKAAAKKAAPKKAAAKKMMPAKKAAAKKAAPRKQMAMTDDKSMLREFFIDELKDIYWAEKHLTKALPKMQKAATSEELKNAFADHLEQTKGHIERLEQVFELMGEPAKAKKCEAMEGITKEGDSIIEDTPKGTATRDVGLILAAQKVEHYEISTYGGLAQLAKTLGLNDVKELLGETLQEEKETDELLTSIAENHINIEAAEEDEDDETEDAHEAADDDMEDDEDMDTDDEDEEEENDDDEEEA